MKNYVCFLLFIIPFLAFSQGRLEKSKEKLASKKSTEYRNSSSTEKKGKQRRNRESNGLVVDLIAEVGFYAFYGVVIGSTEYRSLTPYPYYKDSIGEYLKGDLEDSKRSLFKISANQLFDRGVNGIELNANYRVLPILGIESSHLSFTENSLAGRERLDISSILLKYYRIRENNFSFWWGIGTTYVANEVDTWGFTYSIGTEIFPFKPVSLHSSYKQSFINNASIEEFKIHLKYHIKKAAVYTGYHANLLANEKVNGIVFGAEYTF